MSHGVRGGGLTATEQETIRGGGGAAQAATPQRQPLAQRLVSRRAPARLGSDRADRYGTADALALLSSVSGP